MKKRSLALVAAGILSLGVVQHARADQPHFDIVCVDRDGEILTIAPNVPASSIHQAITVCVHLGGHVGSITKVSDT